ncbi:MAG: AbrB family transcriptional regulator [Boseongicola sp.]
MRQFTALGIGAMGAAIAVRIGIPLPWMLGPMIAVTVAAVSSVPVSAPLILRKILLPILGVMLGSGFHPGIFGQISNWTITVMALPVYIAAAFGIAFLFYRKIGRYDTVTAYYSSAPGGLNDMMILGAEAGGDERRIALAHASRILVVVSFISFFFAIVFDITSSGQSRSHTPFAAVPMTDLMLLLGCAIVGASVAPYFRLPAPQILGPMILSGIIHSTGVTDAPPPSIAVNAAQLVMGTVVGCRFYGVAAREIARDLVLAGGASGSMIIVALFTAFAVTTLSGIPFQQSFLTFSPGGLPEMSLLAIAMSADVAYVATIHILRITIVIAVAPLVFGLLRQKN